MNTLHVKTGDTVMLISGDKKYRGRKKLAAQLYRRFALNARKRTRQHKHYYRTYRAYKTVKTESRLFRALRLA